MTSFPCIFCVLHKIVLEGKLPSGCRKQKFALTVAHRDGLRNAAQFDCMLLSRSLPDKFIEAYIAAFDLALCRAWQANFWLHSNRAQYYNSRTELLFVAMVELHFTRVYGLRQIPRTFAETDAYIDHSVMQISSIILSSIHKVHRHFYRFPLFT